jgi:hypothetical protein
MFGVTFYYGRRGGLYNRPAIYYGRDASLCTVLANKSENRT